MKALLAPLKRLLLQILLLLACYFISRCCFTLINSKEFSDLSVTEFLRLSFYALRYDLSAIFVLNALYIVLLLFPLPTARWKLWQRIAQFVFVTVNAVALLFEISDWAYYPYNFKRSTADVLNMVSRKGDFLALLPRFIVDYWYVPIACIVLIFFLARINRRICRATPLPADTGMHVLWMTLLQLVRLTIVTGIAVIAIRGGLQYIPIGLRNAVQVTDSRYVPIVLNTPFSIINSYATPALEEVVYMPEPVAAKYIPTIKDYANGDFRKKNVVLIILESFSKEFTKLGGRKSYTPFLDSLMDRSLVCTQAYANALHSAEGVPCVIAGIPTLMEEPFPTSNYGTNRIEALPGMLRKNGYQTAFYHGGTNGTMSFDIFASAAGYEKYYGRTEYHNEKDYDGNWGIWDEPYLQYFAQSLSKTQQPFMASVFTLSSHPPYAIPPGYAGKLPKGPLAIQPCIAYTDIALRKFFEKAAREPWFTNTLFVITPDHCSPQNSGGYYKDKMGHYAIPLLFYAPGDTTVKGVVDAPAQQLDILPSVLDYLHYPKKFFAFGNSIFRKDAPRFVINEISGSYQWLMNGYLLRTNDVKPKGLYAFPADSACRNNLLLRESARTDTALLRLQAFIQVYRQALIHNKLTAE